MSPISYIFYSLVKQQVSGIWSAYCCLLNDFLYFMPRGILQGAALHLNYVQSVHHKVVMQSNLHQWLHLAGGNFCQKRHTVYILLQHKALWPQQCVQHRLAPMLTCQLENGTVDFATWCQNCLGTLGLKSINRHCSKNCGQCLEKPWVNVTC